MAESVVTECKAAASNAAFQAKAVRMDVTSEDAGVGVHNANEIAEADVDEFNNMLRVNVTGTFFVMPGPFTRFL
ncbi:hypothetical protein GGS20DRAFT_590187 [Poronia punctata]|nr:hypothetical protein GGS20DRAFT_590187 [Poronia punctata]